MHSFPDALTKLFRSPAFRAGLTSSIENYIKAQQELRLGSAHKALETSEKRVESEHNLNVSKVFKIYSACKSNPELMIDKIEGEMKKTWREWAQPGDTEKLRHLLKLQEENPQLKLMDEENFLGRFIGIFTVPSRTQSAIPYINYHSFIDTGWHAAKSKLVDPDRIVAISLESTGKLSPKDLEKHIHLIRNFVKYYESNPNVDLAKWLHLAQLSETKADRENAASLLNSIFTKWRYYQHLLETNLGAAFAYGLKFDSIETEWNKEVAKKLQESEYTLRMQKKIHSPLVSKSATAATVNADDEEIKREDLNTKRTIDLLSKDLQQPLQEGILNSTVATEAVSAVIKNPGIGTSRPAVSKSKILASKSIIPPPPKSLKLNLTKPLKEVPSKKIRHKALVKKEDIEASLRKTASFVERNNVHRQNINFFAMQQRAANLKALNNLRQASKEIKTPLIRPKTPTMRPGPEVKKPLTTGPAKKLEREVPLVAANKVPKTQSALPPQKLPLTPLKSPALLKTPTKKKKPKRKQMKLLAPLKPVMALKEPEHRPPKLPANFQRVQGLRQLARDTTATQQRHLELSADIKNWLRKTEFSLKPKANPPNKWEKFSADLKIWLAERDGVLEQSRALRASKPVSGLSFFTAIKPTAAQVQNSFPLSSTALDEDAEHSPRPKV